MCHPKQKVLSQELIDDDPFKYMKIDDISILDSVENRSPCPKCGKSRKYFCYTCYVPVTDLVGKLPTVKLPFKIDIIKHKHEIDGKSTAIHASLLAPQDISIYTYPDIPQYQLEDTSKIVLIFPSNSALSVQELYQKHLATFEQPELEPLIKGYNRSTLLKNKIRPDAETIDATTYNLTDLPIKKAVFIDSTWNQSKGIYKDPVLKELQCVVLQNRVSQFWRHQKDSPRWYLATIEAVHQFSVEMHLNAWGYDRNYLSMQYLFHDMTTIQGKEKDSGNSYKGQYDNLLYFFKYMHQKIHSYYCHSELKAYKRPL